jgi:enoyl-[acyl-carrier-protein] reductase (NADH)
VASETFHPSTSSLTALSYLGAVRAVPNYHIIMGPTKASLEALVLRGFFLSLEYGAVVASDGIGTGTDTSGTHWRDLLS